MASWFGKYPRSHSLQSFFISNGIATVGMRCYYFCSCKFFRRSRDGGSTSKRQNRCNRFIFEPVARNRFKKSEASYLENLHSRALKGWKLISQSLHPVVLIYHISFNFRRFKNLDIFFVHLNEQIWWLKSDRTHNLSPTHGNLHRLSKLH